VSERFDIEEVSNCRSELYALMKDGVSVVAFDFTDCQFIDSTGLGLLVSVNKRCAESGAEIYLCNLQVNVANVIKMTRLDQVFPIHNSCS
jgi:anti-sigma B factor antagonist